MIVLCEKATDFFLVAFALQGRRKWGTGGLAHPPLQFLAKQLTLSQPGGADYAHHSTTVLTMLKYVPAALICIGLHLK